MDYSTIDNELGNTNISINDDKSNNNNTKTNQAGKTEVVERKSSDESAQVKESFFSSFFKSKQKDIAIGLISSAKDKSQIWYEKLFCTFKFLDPYFEVNTSDIKTRLISGFVPFSKTFVEIKPDLYGPFWIYTLLIFLISASNSITHLGSKTNQESFVVFIPNAATLVSLIIFIIIDIFYRVCFTSYTWIFD